MGHPAVSVVMPVHNTARFVGAAVESILGQTCEDWELIVVDDGSTDDTPLVLDRYDDPRIRRLRQRNSGAAAARNTALRLATGTFVAWQDADDVSVPHRLSTLVSRAVAAGAGYAHSDMLLIDGDGCPVGYWQARPVEPGHALGYFVAAGTPFNNPTMLIRRELLSGTGFDTSLVIGEDSTIALDVARAAEGAYVPEALLLYRRHGSNTSAGAYDHEDLVAVLARHRPLEVVPQARWSGAAPHEQECVAEAVAALLVLRRGAARVAQDLLSRAAARVPAVRTQVGAVVQAVVALATGDPRAALAALDGAEGPDAIVANLRGEAWARLGDRKQALDWFMAALRADPGYLDPAMGLRGLGGGGFNLVDASWRRYA